ncbi:hypothetical protein MOMA_04585 [Moraxella macacae 0408225]|uniref:HMA domain-containing protein n=1 Tax=Moraxella macacae 0408225 TaxID=1230338 RepID=L2FB40_9GAMM|nr:heavy-metal-associated domain-containing protein [Moraxella macacae]ELA09653.1 hypothetical protein MOMA_04585 [Moraxella macacae 0408225]
MSVKTLVFGIDGMTCNACVNGVTKAIMAVDGVVSCEVSLDDALATVGFDDELTNELALKQAVADAGYEVD